MEAEAQAPVPQDAPPAAVDEIVVVTSHTVPCDGGPLGHPRVYLTVGETGEVVCPYCSRHFVLSEDARGAAGH